MCELEIFFFIETIKFYLLKWHTINKKCFMRFQFVLHTFILGVKKNIMTNSNHNVFASIYVAVTSECAMSLIFVLG